ncbi:MAG: dienelactone hydrolase [uncultured bacterium]|uniref:Hydrolase n=3 Tax=Candidatus Daviesiibacteriota TaxID=1752718 RepID=A0A1F5K4R0_9BACT|nr:MAG: dienelactone hydrolase [uncultured bacterium]KKQ15832.1 MAG: Dienelactone hydrolase [Candidatus Daviesbacteria bacterium GW2011_GWA1_36_8]OGE16882.1 MAG: hydrolase [Candidatus Daviesbacteria bacterium RIFCSPHIGHO2_01_FULL_36_37]OGE31238.1 MAG: hydrolase [Candidatus Daviesbacteria bacterium RIFCSPHIGHO2_02_FULL_37_9]OGE35869.1 MAG: hydrolase [Candidatus Daviesbacteria bacterium RIFCSPHIGHO2_12_FULL_37_16]
MVKNLDVPKDNKDVRSTVTIPVNGVSVEGVLRIPHNPRGIVLFAHGSGSGRHSPRNNFVAEVLRRSRVATLLFDLLTEEEDLDYAMRFEIELLTERLIKATSWIRKQPHLKGLKLGYFGASTGAAAALNAAARVGSDIRAVVSRGGRPDLAMDELAKVKSPTLLIVGEEDPEVLDLNRQAYQAIITTKKLEIIPNATHLFEETGTLEKAAEHASDWFKKYLSHNFKEGFREYDS